jgi:carbonic anhydrase/acetyltransferase-like protein (isoleucine patch superfamily)
MSDSSTILPFAGVTPSIAATAFIAPGCRIIGDVRIGEESSIWYNCVIRGDIGPITIGARTNIQDGTVVHLSRGKQGTEIGDDVLIGHLAMVHGCKLHNHAFVGLGAIVMDDCEIEADGMLAAGAMLTPGKRIPSGQLWAGRPARYVRDLTVEQIVEQRMGAKHYVDNAYAHMAALKTED